MTYEAWRISYQSSEQAARAAYTKVLVLHSALAELVRIEDGTGMAVVGWETAMEKAREAL